MCVFSSFIFVFEVSERCAIFKDTEKLMGYKLGVFLIHIEGLEFRIKD